MREKHLLGPFKGFFMEIKKVEISKKNPSKWLKYVQNMGKTYNQPLQGIFHGDLDFFDLHEKSREMADYMFCPN